MQRQFKGLALALVTFMALACLAACSTDPAAEQAAAQPGDATRLVSETQAGEIPADPLAARLQGLDLDEFFEVSWRELSLRDPETVLADGLAGAYGLEGAELTDISDAYTNETYAMYATVLGLLREYDRAALTPEQQVSYDVYEWYLDDRVRKQEFMYHDYPATFYPITAVHMELIHFFTDLHPVAEVEDAQDYVARLRQVEPKFEQLLEGLKLREEAGIVPPRFAIQWALYSLRSLAQARPARTPFYQTLMEKVDTLPDISEAEKQGLLKDAEEAIEESVLPAYRALVEYLEHQESVAPNKDGVWQFDKGDEYYAYLLRHYTTTSMTADEIHELGQQELERIHAEMRATFDKLGYPADESLPELFNRVAQDSGYVGASEIIETYESLIEGADQNLDPAFDIRPEASVVVVESPIKGMYVSAATDGSRPGAFHAGPTDSREEYYAMPTLAYHEAIPGHHFQIALAQEADLPTFRNLIGFTGFAEGWALYAERLASELGWYEDDPYGDLGRLQAEAFRAARLVVDTGIHAKHWDFEKAARFFIDNTGYDTGDAVDSEIEIARYIVWPGQSTAYKVGMLKILELRQRAKDQLGSQFDLKEFHSLVLRNGSMPLEVLEQVVDEYIQDRSQVSRPQPPEGPQSSGSLSASTSGDQTPVLRDLDGVPMVLVPAGEFLMGSDEDSGEESPAHSVYVDEFWLDRTEVTYGEYVRFLNHLGDHKGQCAGHDCNETKDVDRQSHMLFQDGRYVVENGFEGYPMAEVSWYGAEAYCAWVGKRLPTEAEWEKAARGTDGRRYPWGNSEPDCSKLNYRTCVRHTIDVGSYPTGASPYGALDMAGNVWEWTADWYDADYYQTTEASQSNPPGPESGVLRVARGGSSYDLDLFLVRTTYRFGNDPYSHHRLVGFRCAQSTPTTMPGIPVEEDGSLRITVVYDNTTVDPDLTAAWGFAALLEYDGHTLLFDTGGDSSLLLDNMAKLGLDPGAIEIVVLSHIHGDHTDGLRGLLATGVKPTVYVPASFPDSFKRSVGYRTEVVEVREPLEILPGVHSSGEFRAAVNEQGLVVETADGNVVITGCAHPGIVRMVRKARELVDGDIALVIGGFHLGDQGEADIDNIITNFRALDVRQVSPTHCTGAKAIGLFADEYGDDFVLGGVGRVVVVGSDASENAAQPAAPWPTEGWATSTPEAQGMDSEMLADMLEAIQKQGYGIDSVTIVRHGHLVADATVYPFQPDRKHIIHSCTKSMVSALIGIAIEQGYIESVDERVLDLLPGRIIANLDSKKAAMTLEHLLTMATGLECRDSYLYRWRGLDQMRHSDDWVRFMLELPMAEAPGTRFEYCNGASFLLSAIIQEATGMSALAYAEEHLFGPLGITDLEWPSNSQGISIGWGELRMRPHDMAKIGHLYLNEGLWDGEQVVPSAWVESSTRKHIPATLQDGYGYQWWVDDSGYYMALGYAGQFIFVLPELDMVVAFTSDLDETDFYVPQQLLTDYVLPAARSFGPLPDNPSGAARLQARIEALASR